MYNPPSTGGFGRTLRIDSLSPPNPIMRPICYISCFHQETPDLLTVCTSHLLTPRSSSFRVAQEITGLGFHFAQPQSREPLPRVAQNLFPPRTQTPFFPCESLTVIAHPCHLGSFVHPLPRMLKQRNKQSHLRFPPGILTKHSSLVLDITPLRIFLMS